MDVLQFISSVVGSLAWPGVVLAAVLVLRKPLIDLLPLLQRLKYKDLELDFGKRVGELQAEVAEELPPQAEPAPLPTTARSALHTLAEVSPRSAVMEAWRAVEAAGLAAARRLQSDLPTPALRSGRPLDSYEALRLLEHSGKLDRAVVGPLRELRMLRNQAAHAPEFALTRDSALEYASVAERIAAHLNQVAEKVA